jgi:hypothetical protein
MMDFDHKYCLIAEDLMSRVPFDIDHLASVAQMRICVPSNNTQKCLLCDFIATFMCTLASLTRHPEQRQARYGKSGHFMGCQTRAGSQVVD